MDASQPNARGLSSLGAVVEARRKALDLSYRDVAGTAKISPSFVHRIGSGELTRMPSRRVMEGLSDALQVPVEVLIAAASSDLGLVEVTIHDDQYKAVYISAKDAALTPAEVQQILTMIDTMRRANLYSAERQRSSA